MIDIIAKQVGQLFEKHLPTRRERIASQVLAGMLAAADDRALTGAEWRTMSQGAIAGADAMIAELDK